MVGIFFDAFGQFRKKGVRDAVEYEADGVAVPTDQAFSYEVGSISELFGNTDNLAPSLRTDSGTIVQRHGNGGGRNVGDFGNILNGDPVLHCRLIQVLAPNLKGAWIVDSSNLFDLPLIMVIMLH